MEYSVGSGGQSLWGLCNLGESSGHPAGRISSDAAVVALFDPAFCPELEEVISLTQCRYPGMRLWRPVPLDLTLGTIFPLDVGSPWRSRSERVGDDSYFLCWTFQ